MELNFHGGGYRKENEGFFENFNSTNDNSFT